MTRPAVGTSRDGEDNSQQTRSRGRLSLSPRGRDCSRGARAAGPGQRPLVAAGAGVATVTGTGQAQAGGN